MKKDVGFYVEANIEKVYQAYVSAATNPPFERTCTLKPLHTISFGVNYSFKYNMNGGGCHIHLMPCGTGTAVNIRFSIAQAMGARCDRYANDLNQAMLAFLPVAIRPASYNMDDFLKPENQVVSAAQPTPPAAPQAPAPQTPAPQAPAPRESTDIRYCVNCGNPLAPGAHFCGSCGTKLSVPTPKACPRCYTPAAEGDAFCSACGTKL